MYLFVSKAVRVGFIVEKVALGQVVPTYFGFSPSGSFAQYSIFVSIYHVSFEAAEHVLPMKRFCCNIRYACWELFLHVTLFQFSHTVSCTETTWPSVELKCLSRVNATSPEERLTSRLSARSLKIRHPLWTPTRRLSESHLIAPLRGTNFPTLLGKWVPLLDKQERLLRLHEGSRIKKRCSTPPSLQVELLPSWQLESGCLSHQTFVQCTRWTVK